MKLMIVGNARHGKDTAADVLGKAMGTTPLASSWVACELFLFDELKYQGFKYDTAQEAWESRLVSNRMRRLWFEEIKKFNTPDRTRLMRAVYERSDIYTGLRDHHELFAGREAGLIDLCIWVDASDRLPPEPRTSMTVTRGMADIVIENNGTEEEFRNRVERLASALFPVTELPDIAPCPGCGDDYHPGPGKRCEECGYKRKEICHFCEDATGPDATYPNVSTNGTCLACGRDTCAT
jgi:hypothetical protein